MKLVINYMKKILFIFVLLYYGLPMKGISDSTTNTLKKVVSEQIINKYIEAFMGDMINQFDEENQKLRMNILIQSLAPAFNSMELSLQELDTILSDTSAEGKYFRRALSDTISGTENSTGERGEIYFTDYTEYFKPQARAYYLSYVEGESCAVFDKFFSEMVQLKNIFTGESSFSEQEIRTFEDDFERFLTNISCTLTTSIYCFKNHVAKFSSDATILNRFTKAAVIAYAITETVHKKSIEAYNNMNRFQKAAMKLKFWGKEVTQVPQDYIYTAMAKLSLLYDKDTWNNYIDTMLSPFLKSYFTRFSDTQGISITDSIARRAKDPSFLARHWKKIVGGASVSALGLVYYYNKQNLQEAYGQGYGRFMWEVISTPFSKSSWQAAFEGLRTGYLGQGLGSVRSRIGEYLPSTPRWLGGKGSAQQGVGTPSSSRWFDRWRRQPTVSSSAQQGVGTQSSSRWFDRWRPKPTVSGSEQQGVGTPSSSGWFDRWRPKPTVSGVAKTAAGLGVGYGAYRYLKTPTEEEQTSQD